MAAPKEKLPSLGHLTHMERKTFTKQRYHCLTNSKVMQLQQRWQELKERELRAQQHNEELLRQFEEAQETLREMLECTAAMKTIRVAYERYLKESSPRWQQQLKEKTQAAQRMRMEDNRRSCLKNTKVAEVTKAYADQGSPGCIKQTQHVAGTQDKNNHSNHADCNQDSSPYHPYIQASWLTHPQSQTAGIPKRASHPPQSSSHFPPSFLPHSHPFMLHHLSSTPSLHPCPRQNAPVWSSLEADCPWFWTAGAPGLPEALWAELYNKEPPTELMASSTVAQRSEISGASSSKSEKCGERRSSRLSQELDVKPVRLSSGHAESSESGRDSTQVKERRKKEKRGRSQCTASQKESHSSEESSRTSSAAIIASAAVVQSSESDASSGKCKKRRQRSGVQVAGSLSIEKALQEKIRNEGRGSASQRSSEESGRQTDESTDKNAENSSADDKSEVCKEDSGSISIQLKSKARDEKQKQEISSEQSSSGEKDEDDEHEEDLGGENKENSSEGDVEDEEANDSDEKDKCLKERDDKKDEEEADEEEKATEDEMEEQECEVKDDCDKRSSASSQDEEDESEQDKTEEDEEGSDEEEQGESEEEQRSGEGEPEEESDSKESIISPQETRRHIIPEEAADDDGDKEKKANKAGFSDGDDNGISEEDDIENLLVPQEQRQKREDKDLKPAGRLKVSDMKIVVEDRSTKITPQHSDSDESDHFYD